MDLPVGDGHVFGSKVVSWISLLVTVTFLDQRWSVGTPVSDGHIFGSKEVSWDPASRWFHGFSWFLVGFHGFSRWFHSFSWFLVGFHGFVG